MYKYLLFSLFVAFMLFAGFVGCASSSVSDDELFCQFSNIDVSPDGPIELGLFEEVVFEISLQYYDGTPVSDGPVFVDFIGPAHNATVVLYTELDDEQSTGMPYIGYLNTDEQGLVKVLFRAPDTEAEFSIRFSSPAVEADAFMVDVMVDPSLLSTSLEVDYVGSREIAVVEAELFEQMLCDDLELYDKPVPMDSMVMDEYPGIVSFSGLRNGHQYAIKLSGLNSSGETRAFACVDGILPNEPSQVVFLEDTVLDLSGYFETSSDVAPNGVLGMAVDEIAVALDESSVINESNFVTNPQGAILDAIREVVIAMDPLDGDPFDEIREENDLDMRLGKLFTNNSVDVGESFVPIWTEVKDYLDEMSFYGSMEIGSPNTGNYPVSHRIDELVFGDGPTPGVPVIFDATSSEAVSSVLYMNSSNPDLVNLAPHGIGIGLGGVIHFLTQEALMEYFDTPQLAEAMNSIVDCETVTEYLLPWLSEVAASPAIESGCLLATEHAQDKLEFGATELNLRYATIEISGSMSAVVPDEVSQVSFFEDGLLSLTWSGEDFEGEETEIGPMEATFEAELKTEDYPKN